MASSKPKATIEAEDLRLFRLRKIDGYVSRNVLHLVFLEETKGRPKNKTLFEFYEDNGVPIAKFEKGLNKAQIERIEIDPEGKSFDVTLLYKCIQWGNINVANKNYDKWKEDDNWRLGTACLESLLTFIKKKRNEFAHEEPKYTQNEFVNKTEELRKLLTETLRLVGMRYKISQSSVDQWIKDIDADINFLRDKSLIPSDLADYKKQNLFVEKSQMVRGEGKLSLDKLYDGWDSISPASLILKFQFKVKLIFTQMVILGESKKGKKETELKFEDLLENISHTINDPVILVEGIAGVGKTTLTKKLLSDWTSGRSIIHILPSYDLLLYAECRNKSIKSFKELLVSLMPDLARSFQDNDFSNVVLDQKVILIMDGLDELNSSSRSLFEDVLELKKTNDRLTIMVTTRPEKVQTYYSLVNHLHIQTKHIKLIGIPAEKINEFVTKYEEEMKQESLSTDDISKLLDYLTKTAYRLQDLWILPYNLILLLILWRTNPTDVYSISTAPELYWKIHQMVRSKLISRLLHNDVTRDISEHFLEKKVDEFISNLGMEAVMGLIKNDINLPEEAYKRLEDACVKENIPPEEMTGAFLKTIIIRTPGGMDKKHSFNHKGSQEFAAALNIFEDILHRLEMHDVSKAGHEIKQLLLTYKNFPTSLALNIRKIMKDYLEDATASTSTSTASISATTASISPSTDSTSASTVSILVPTASTLVPTASTLVPTASTLLPPASPQAGNSSHDSTVIIDILKDLHGCSPIELKRFQNVLIILMGMFYLQKDKIPERIKMEALLLLEESGIKRRTDWIRILNSVKCDDFVATFISQRPGILGPGILGHDKDKAEAEIIKIEDFSLLGYITLLKALKSPLEGIGNGKFFINIKGDITGLNELLEQINVHQLNVTKIYLHHNFKHLDSHLMVEDALNNIFRRCQVKKYRGRVTPGLVLPFTLRVLYASISEEASLQPLFTFLNSPQQHLRGFGCLHVCVRPDMVSTPLEPLPDGSFLYILDIQDVKDVEKAINMAQQLNPTTRTRQFSLIYFPSLSPSVPVEEILLRIKEKKGRISVLQVVFPSYCRKGNEEELMQIATDAGVILHWGDLDLGYGIRKLDDW